MIARDVFSEEHELFRASVRRFVEKELVPYHGAWEAAHQVSREAWLKAGREGLLLCNVPAEYGGQGGDFLHSAVVIEEMGRANVSGPGFFLHSDVVAPYFLRYGTEGQKKRWLPPMARGEVITAIAMSEPGKGSDLRHIETVAVAEGNEYRISGQKTYISNGQLADLVVVAAQTVDGGDQQGISLFLVEAERDGFARGRNLEKIGLRAQDTSELFFDSVRIPAANVLGKIGEGFRQLTAELAQERLVQALRAAAAAEAALETTVEWVLERKIFGQTLASFQNTRFVLAELSAALRVQRAFVDRCLALHAQHRLDSTDAAIVKMTAAENWCRVADECLQLFGGAGYMLESPIAKSYVDARASKIAAGSVEVMKTIISRELLGSTR